MRTDLHAVKFLRFVEESLEVVFVLQEQHRVFHFVRAECVTQCLFSVEFETNYSNQSVHHLFLRVFAPVRGHHSDMLQADYFGLVCFDVTKESFGAYVFLPQKLLVFTEVHYYVVQDCFSEVLGQVFSLILSD